MGEQANAEIAKLKFPVRRWFSPMSPVSCVCLSLFWLYVYLGSCVRAFTVLVCDFVFQCSRSLAFKRARSLFLSFRVYEASSY